MFGKNADYRNGLKTAVTRIRLSFEENENMDFKQKEMYEQIQETFGKDKKVTDLLQINIESKEKHIEARRDILTDIELKYKKESIRLDDEEEQLRNGQKADKKNDETQLENGEIRNGK